MSSRTEILAKIKNNQPEFRPLPSEDLIFSGSGGDYTDRDNIQENTETFRTVLTNIGGAVIELHNLAEVGAYISAHYGEGQRIISTLAGLSSLCSPGWENDDPHDLENVALAVIGAHFGVAENAALWITEELMQQRVVPFICQQLAVVLHKNKILATMHHAYDQIGDAPYGFGAFIAGPSKTADIEQSLVLGAHGPKGMTVFLLTEEER